MRSLLIALVLAGGAGAEASSATIVLEFRDMASNDARVVNLKNKLFDAGFNIDTITIDDAGPAVRLICRNRPRNWADGVEKDLCKGDVYCGKVVVKSIRRDRRGD
jgi:hypothetical protein